MPHHKKIFILYTTQRKRNKFEWIPLNTLLGRDSYLNIIFVLFFILLLGGFCWLFGFRCGGFSVFLVFFQMLCKSREKVWVIHWTGDRLAGLFRDHPHAIFPESEDLRHLLGQVCAKKRQNTGRGTNGSNAKVVVSYRAKNAASGSLFVLTRSSRHICVFPEMKWERKETLFLPFCEDMSDNSETMARFATEEKIQTL